MKKKILSALIVLSLSITGAAAVVAVDSPTKMHLPTKTGDSKGK